MALWELKIDANARCAVKERIVDFRIAAFL
jgi:hypothetical protein